MAQPHPRHSPLPSPSTMAGGEKLPLLSLPFDAFSRLYQEIMQRDARPDREVATLQSIAAAHGVQGDATWDEHRRLPLELGQANFQLYTMFGRPSPLSLVTTLLEHGQRTLPPPYHQDISAVARYVLRQLVHEAEKNTLTEQDFLRHILVHNLLHEPEREGDLNVLQVMLGQKLYDKFRNDILFEYFLHRAPHGTSADMVFQSRIEEEILRPIALRRYEHTQDTSFAHVKLSAFELLKNVLTLHPALDIKHGDLPMIEELREEEQNALLGMVVTEQTEMLWKKPVIQRYLQDMHLLIRTALTHKQATGPEKNLLVMLSVADTYLKQILTMTTTERNKYPHVYFAMEYQRHGEEGVFGAMTFDMDAWRSQEGYLAAAPQHPTLLKERYKSLYDDHAQKVRHGKATGEYSQKYEDIFAKYLLRSVVYSQVLEAYGLSRVEPSKLFSQV